MNTKNSILILFGLLACSAALNPIIIKGTKFFDSVTGNQFYVVGVDYQPSTDPIADTTGLKRDIPYLQSLGVNTVRCYQTDPTLNHDDGMQMLANAGIYVMIDVSDPNYSIISSAPSWTTYYFNFFRTKVDAFGKYSNLLGFLAANEVILAPGTTNAGAFVKAAIRDLKSYISYKGYNKPVGYAAADVPTNDYLQPFLDCNSAAESADFYGMNIYRWCGQQTFQTSGYQSYHDEFVNYGIPIIFTEYGCNSPSPRSFQEVQTIYGPQMTDILSGGLVYEWIQEANNFGLVQINSSTVLHVLPDYNTLKSQLANINPSRTTLGAYTATTGLQSCPAVSSNWQSAYSPLPPTPNAPSCQCMFQQLSCRTSMEDPTTLTTAQMQIIGNTLNYICGNFPQDCAAIGTNPAAGSYGQWSDCNSLEQVSWAMNQYYLANNQASGACNFNGLGSVYTPTVSSSVQCQNTPNNFASGTPATPTPSTTSATPTPSTSSAAATSSSGNTANCPSTLQTCGQACYNPSQYCCQNGQLTQASLCSQTPSSAATRSSTSSAAATSSTAAATPSTTSSGAQPPVNNGNCGVGTYSCGASCYTTDNYCCVNGQLTQKQFCPALTPNPTTSAAATPATSSTKAAAAPTSSSSATLTCNGCGASSCCPDYANGNLCYSPNNYNCVNDQSNGHSYLCGKGGASCNGACYDQSKYQCVNGNISQ